MRFFCSSPAHSSPGLLMSAALMLVPAIASAASPWTVKGRGPNTYIETRSLEPGGRLVLDCEDGLRLYYYPPPEWDGNRLDDTAVSIDGERTAVNVEGLDESVLLSDLPNNGLGISHALLDKLRSGKDAVIEGSAVTRVAGGKRRFTLAGAAPAIAALERRCPAARRG